MVCCPDGSTGQVDKLESVKDGPVMAVVRDRRYPPKELRLSDASDLEGLARREASS